MNFFDTLEKRRSRYDFGTQPSMKYDELEEMIWKVVKVTPDAFNMQSQKILVLFGKESEEFWKKVDDTYDNKIDEDKLKGFKNAQGTVLYFQDQNTVDDLMDEFPKYAENFPKWADQSNGMLQINLWNAFAAEGYGASLQHYNPGIDDWVKEDYGIPEEWTLLAQMPFGPMKPSDPDKKDKLPKEKRMKVVK